MMKKRSYLDKKERTSTVYHVIQVSLFFILLFAGCVIGFLMPLRPAVSDLEKRELTQFPTFSKEAFIDGSYFKQMDTWYADTFPFRDQLLAVNSDIQELYGVRGQQIHGGGNQSGDEIPTGPADITPSSADIQNPTPSQQESTPAISAAGEEGSAGSENTVAPQLHGSIYIDGKDAYGIYYFNLEAANLYIDAVNRMANGLNGQATVYAMMIPNNSGILLSEAKQKEIGGSDQTAAIDYYYKSMDASVKKVPIFDTLSKHKQEKIFFSTDHHWTALGAYYSYEQFAAVKGIKAHALEDYEKMSFPNFIGSYYSSTQAKELKDNPEVIDAYVPISVNRMVITEKDGNHLNWPIVNDVSSYSAGNKYSCFIGGDNPYSVIDNPAVQDGSICLVIKESFGNALVPFLVDHYQKIIVVDYRYYQDNLIQLARNNNVTDVIFANNIEAISGKQIMTKMNALVQ